MSRKQPFTHVGHLLQGWLYVTFAMPHKSFVLYCSAMQFLYVDSFGNVR